MDPTTPRLVITPDDSKAHIFVRASVGYNKKVSLSQKVNDKVQTIFDSIKAEALKDVSSPEDWKTTVNFSKETVTLKNTRTGEVKTVSLGDPSPSTTNKVRQLIREGRVLIVENSSIARSFKLPSLDEKGSINAVDQFSTRELISNEFPEFKNVLPMISAQVEALTDEKKVEFYQKLGTAIKAHKELKTYFETNSTPPNLATLEADLSKAIDDYKKKDDEKKALKRELSILNMKLAQADASKKTDIEREITTKQAEIDAKTTELEPLATAKDAAEKALEPFKIMQEYQNKFKKIDAYALAMALLHSDEFGVANTDLKEIQKKIEENQPLLKSPNFLQRIGISKRENLKNPIKSYAMDIQALAKRTDDEKALIYGVNYKPMTRGSKPEELVMHFVHAKGDKDKLSFHDIDPRLAIIQDQLKDLDTSVKIDDIFEGSTIKSLRQFVDDCGK
jgi:hypothetical protein